MNKFNDFGIKAEKQSFTGNKMKINFVIDQDIVVYAFLIAPSKHTEGNFLSLQISIKEIKYVVFTGSQTLMDMIRQVPEEKFPFRTKIVRNEQRFEFT